MLLLTFYSLHHFHDKWQLANKDVYLVNYYLLFLPWNMNQGFIYKIFSKSLTREKRTSPCDQEFDPVLKPYSLALRLCLYIQIIIEWKVNIYISYSIKFWDVQERREKVCKWLVRQNGCNFSYTHLQYLNL